jgi:hypothetical protein
MSDVGTKPTQDFFLLGVVEEINCLTLRNLNYRKMPEMFCKNINFILGSVGIKKYSIGF